MIMRKITTAFAILAFFNAAHSARADLIIMAPTIQVTQGDTGSFDLLIYSTGDSFQVAGDSIELSLSGLAGVTFTDVSIATSTPYVFVLSGTTVGAGAFAEISPDQTAFMASDAEFADPGYTQIDNTSFFGIAHVSFLVDTTAFDGDRGLIFGDGTSVSDVNGDPVTVTTMNGTLSVRAVPEPSTAVLFSAGMLCIMACRIRSLSSTPLSTSGRSRFRSFFST